MAKKGLGNRFIYYMGKRSFKGRVKLLDGKRYVLWGAELLDGRNNC